MPHNMLANTQIVFRSTLQHVNETVKIAIANLPWKLTTRDYLLCIFDVGLYKQKRKQIKRIEFYVGSWT